MEVIGGIAAVAQLCSVVSKYISSAAGASEARRQLQNYIQECQALLAQLTEKSNEPEKTTDWTRTVRLLHERGSPLITLKQTLEIISKELEGMNHGSLGKTLTKLRWPFDEPKVEKLVLRFGRDIQLLQVALAGDAQKLMEDMLATQGENSRAVAELADLFGSHSVRTESQLNEVEVGLGEIRDVQANMKDYVDAGMKDRILRWLTPIDYGSEHSDFVSRQQPGTGGWLLESAEFKTWTGNAGQTLFCPGIPGAGKTMLTSIVVDRVLSEFSADPDVAIAFIYCSYRRRDEQSLQHLLSSIVKQLATHKTRLPALKDLYDKHCARNTRPSIQELEQVLASVASVSSRIFIVIDALDESDQTYSGGGGILKSVFTLRDSHQANIFATSRAIPDIVDQFRGFPTLEIQATEEDVKTFIEGYFQDNSGRLSAPVRKNKTLRDEIKDTISKAVHGMFLLAHLYIRSLEDKATVRKVKTALEHFAQQNPQSAAVNSSKTGDYRRQVLQTAYTEVMERIMEQKGERRTLAIRALAWVLRAETPLTDIQLRHALATEIAMDDDEITLDEDMVPDMDDIISACVGLITVDQSNNHVRLIHYTTFDFLRDTQEQWSPFDQTTQRIVETCIFTFNLLGRSAGWRTVEMGRLRQKYALSDWATYHWGEYARLFPSSEAVVNFLLDDDMVAYADFIHSPVIHRHMSGLHLACYWGIDYAIPTLLKHNPAAVSMSLHLQPRGHLGDMTTPLMLAVKLPEDWRRSTNDRCSERCSTIRLLYQHSSCKYPIPQTQAYAALVYVVYTLEDVQLCKLLMSLGNLDVNTRMECGRTMLSLAVEDNDLFFVNILLKKEHAEVDLRDSLGRTPLSYSKLKRITEVLLDAGADAASKDHRGWTPLMHVMAGERPYAEESLLLTLIRASHGKELNIGDQDGCTVLIHAVGRGLEAVVRLLLEQQEVDPNIPDKFGRSPLLYAVFNSRVDEIGSEKRTEYESLVQLLLQQGNIDVNAQDIMGFTPLLVAIRLGNPTVVGMLLNRDDIELDLRDRVAHYNALSWAAALREDHIVKLLLKKYSKSGQTWADSDLNPALDFFPRLAGFRCFFCLDAIPSQVVAEVCEHCSYHERFWLYLWRRMCRRCYETGQGCLSGGPHQVYETSESSDSGSDYSYES